MRDGAYANRLIRPTFTKFSNAWARLCQRSQELRPLIVHATGEVRYGRVPAYSVVVPGAMPSDKGGPSLACAVIVKRVDERTRSKTSINELLRD